MTDSNAPYLCGSSLGALEATFDDAYRVALQTLRDTVMADVSPLLKGAQSIASWRAAQGMSAVLATIEDFFGDFEPKLLPAAYVLDAACGVYTCRRLIDLSLIAGTVHCRSRC